MADTGIGNKYIDALNESVRPLITLMFGITVCRLALTGTLPKEALVAMAGMIFGFWFQQRQADKSAAATTAAVTAAVLAEKKNGGQVPPIPITPA